MQAGAIIDIRWKIEATITPEYLTVKAVILNTMIKNIPSKTA
jgi:hypothetical protein